MRDLKGIFINDAQGDTENKKHPFGCFSVFDFQPRTSGLFSNGSFNGAGCCASAAIDALVLVDFVLAVLFADSANGAVFCTCTATDASVCNYVCH